jgi:cyclopropane fatty-acyl-phospholipid synthase-like methyltransferase
MAQTSDLAAIHIRDLISASLRIRPGSRILEAGCGAGAVLSLLRDTGATLAGADFSAPHISIARQFLPEADLRVAEAAQLPWPDAAFDAVFSYGVFLYFPHLAYAEGVLEEMLRVATPGAPILIVDIPDASRREACESARRAAGAAMSPPHCYYPKSFFENFASARGLSARIFDQQVPGYANSAFRFNALIGAL